MQKRNRTVATPVMCALPWAVSQAPSEPWKLCEPNRACPPERNKKWNNDPEQARGALQPFCPAPAAAARKGVPGRKPPRMAQNAKSKGQTSAGAITMGTCSEPKTSQYARNEALWLCKLHNKVLLLQFYVRRWRRKRQLAARKIQARWSDAYGPL